MSRITINSNLASLQVGRRLERNTNVLRRSFERLSSGLRINRASDDAAGLAVSAGLEVDARVFSQGIRNLNDGIGMLNIADGALGELSGIVIRIRELATQSANGALSNAQRKALDEEAEELSKEFSRIAQTASFNGLSLLGSDFDQLSLQAGYGSAGSIQSDLGGAIGDRTFTTSSGGEPGISSDFLFADVDHDGNLDRIYADSFSNELVVERGNGRGEFAESQALDIGTQTGQMVEGDFNNDGNTDLAIHDVLSDQILILSSDAGGTFSQTAAYSVSSQAVGDVRLGDVNGDGQEDLILSLSTGSVEMYLGSADGSFAAPSSQLFSAAFEDFEVADLNGDGLDDIVGIEGSTSNLVTLLANGDGTFSETGRVAVSGNTAQLAVSDFDGDGITDALVAYNSGSSDLQLFSGSASGTFSASEVLASGIGLDGLEVFDLDGDGFDDIVSFDNGAEFYDVNFGDGAGGISQDDTLVFDTSGIAVAAVAFGDLNNDGVADLSVLAGGDLTFTSISNTTSGTAALLPFSLASRYGALQAMSILDRKLSDIAGQRGSIGAFISRVSTGISNLSVAETSYAAAKSRITDVDVASEASQLARSQILQQASASVLSQANQAPSLALGLLSA